METKAVTRLLILGNPSEHHVGAHLLAAARQLGVAAEILDLRKAWGANRWVNRFYFHVLGHRPSRLGPFDAGVLAACQEFQPQLLLVTGISPPRAVTLRQIGALGIRRVNFLTDDPWNPRNGAGYFWKSLPHYEVIYSPRRANLKDLENHGCRRVSYLPFAYNPEVHFPEPPDTAAERERFGCDVAIVGGGDEDRIPIALALARAGFKLNLYGGYWDQHPELRPCWKGFVHGRELRMAVSGTTVNIGMVRQANRDGNAMRSLEFPAMGACLVAVDTAEHRELFGGEGDCVEYYSSIEEMRKKVRVLCDQPERARLLGQRLHARICQENRHTYADRLSSVLGDAIA